VIHTTADFSYRENLYFTEHAVEHALAAIRKGLPIITDTTMALSGINKSAAAKYGITVHCFIGDEDVKEQAAKTGMTRSAVSVEKAARLYPECIYAVGNAPTALMRLYELIEEGMIRPALIIGVPVGFVNVVEAKELILKTDVPAIVARGRKGGSNVAAAICNALLYKER
jgi:precorrin-8X/cobalt-precorrin-8 methylmutase